MLCFLFSRLSRPPRAALRAALPLLVVGATLGAGCTEKRGPSLGWSIEFACPSDREDADALSLEVRKGGCSGESVYDTAIARGETPAQGDAIAPGDYGLFARASRGGQTVAQGCVEATLPAADPPVIVLISDTCRANLDDSGPSAMDAAEADAGERDDAGDSATDDDADIDADIDADADVPPVCPPDCSDTDLCTDDRCEDGICVHEPFDGARECDHIDCTAGDLCVLGTCQPGTPNDQACPDDGDLCTAETCVAGAGCNRAPSDGNNCTDGIACTANDICRAGVCRGSDNCPGGVCSAGENQCISGCTKPDDCNDNFDCTVDVCASNGLCVHNPVTGGECDDNIGCTVNDTCSAGVCAGTSTCPATATCAGSTCACPAAQSLCAASCVDNNTSTAHCGLCNRPCGSAQICQNGACRPSTASAPNCTARRSGGHDYLFCTDNLNWNDARTRCRNAGFGLAIIDSDTENTFLQSQVGAQGAWIGANDRGDDSSNCKLAGSAKGEGRWFWASATTTNEQGTALCTYRTAAPAGCIAAADRYMNWQSTQPDNSGCFSVLVASSPGQDCGLILANGTWDDADCGNGRPYVCESP